MPEALWVSSNRSYHCVGDIKTQIIGYWEWSQVIGKNISLLLQLVASNEVFAPQISYKCYCFVILDGFHQKMKMCSWLFCICVEIVWTVGEFLKVWKLWPWTESIKGFDWQLDHTVLIESRAESVSPPLCVLAELCLFGFIWQFSLVITSRGAQVIAWFERDWQSNHHSESHL